jgi:hypothetical protein
MKITRKGEKYYDEDGRELVDDNNGGLWTRNIFGVFIFSKLFLDSRLSENETIEI